MWTYQLCMIRSEVRWYRACSVSLLSHPILASNVSPLPCTMFLNPELSVLGHVNYPKFLVSLYPVRRHHPDTIRWWFIVWTICFLYLLCRVSQLSIPGCVNYVSSAFDCIDIAVPYLLKPTSLKNGILRRTVCSASDVSVLFLLYSCSIFALFLSDPGKPGVRSLGPDVCPSVSEWDTLLRLYWCDSGWWGYQLNTNW